MKINNRVESLMALAAGLSQRGHFRATIHLKGKEMFLANGDATLIIRASLPQIFDQEISFSAEDYDSDKVDVKGKRVIFSVESDSGEYCRDRIVKPPALRFRDLKKLWRSLETKMEKAGDVRSFSLNRSIISLLEEKLSHVEILSEEKGLKLVQRDIYSGRMNVIRKNESGLLKQSVPDFPAFGLRTSDFITLFEFGKTLGFKFSSELGFLFVSEQGGNERISACVSRCFYDELGTIIEGG